MRFIIHAIFLCLLASCFGGTSPKPVNSNSGQGGSSADLNQALDDIPCPNTNDFRGTGIGDNEIDALAQARSNMALEHFSQKLKSNVQIIGQNIDKVASTSTKTSIEQEVALANAQDAKLSFSARRGNKTGVIACMSRADAAKGFAERQRLVVDSLELASSIMLNTEHPKHKNEAWQRTQIYYNSIVAIQNLLNGWGVAKTDYFDKAGEIYSKTREDYKKYCQTTKLHWNPEKKSSYSEIAFSKLSSGIKMENTSCTGRSISLVYKEAKPECESHGGLYGCSYQPFLSITSCNGAELRLLENPAPIKGFGQKEEIAVEKLQDKLKKENFWKEWEQEIKQWSPQCEQ